MNDEAYFAQLEWLESRFHMPRIWINTATGEITFDKVWTTPEAEQLHNTLIAMYPYTQEYKERHGTP